MSYFVINQKEYSTGKQDMENHLFCCTEIAPSSTMFEMLLPLYQKHFRVILIDFFRKWKIR